MTWKMICVEWIIIAIIAASQPAKFVCDYVDHSKCHTPPPSNIYNNKFTTNIPSAILKTKPRISLSLSLNLTQSDLDHAARVGHNVVRDLDTFEHHLLEKAIFRAKRTACTIFFFQEPVKARSIFRDAIAALETTRFLQHTFHLTPIEAGQGLANYPSKCFPKPQCVPGTHYRHYDGSCNNLRYPNWGQTYTASQRLLPPNYSDGLQAFRRSVINNAELPSARLVTLTVTNDQLINLRDVTLIFMVWGQMLAHDFSHSPRALHANGRALACCTKDGDFLPKAITHPWCAPIALPAGDPFYAPLHRRCIGFVRSTWTLRSDCTLGHIEQMNQVTHWLDGSSIYGSSETVARSLRSFVQGKLRVSVTEHGDYLPRRANTQFEAPVCFDAGDSRVQEQFTTAVLNTILLREHNRIATQLSRLNPRWSDERLYQESRRIVIAILQHVTYSEYLLILLGEKFAVAHGLTTPTVGYFAGYSEYVNPSLVNEFGVAAFRMGHSQIQPSIPILDADDRPMDILLLRHTYEDSRKLILPHYLDGALRGMTSLPAQRVDRSFTLEVTNHLFQGISETFGEDLVSINIQRGRDHGVRSYNDYRELCGLQRAKTFADLRNDIDRTALEGFEKVYASVDDIDLYPGGVSEFPLKDSLLGPTFHCITADQFLRLRKGDRYFYDVGEQPHSFTPSQLHEIRKVTLARLFCDNGDDFKMVQSSVFRLAKAPNVRVPCENSEIPRMDLNAWRES